MESSVILLKAVADAPRVAASEHSSDFQGGLGTEKPGRLALFDGSRQQARDYFAQPGPSGPVLSPLPYRTVAAHAQRLGR